MKELFIYCAGGVGKEIRAIAERKNAMHRYWSSIRFVDDEIGKPKGDVLRYADFLDLRCPTDAVEFLIGNGEPVHRKTLLDKIRADGHRLATLIDDTAVVAANTVVEAGAVLYPYVCVSPNAIIGENSLLYYHCSVAHDSEIGANSLLSMSVSVSGHCRIGCNCFLGANSVVRENVTLGERSILGAGSILLHDAPTRGVYVGAPACRIHNNEIERVFF